MTKTRNADKSPKTSARKAAATLESQATARPVGGKSEGGRRANVTPTPGNPTPSMGGLPVGSSSPVDSLSAEPSTPAKPPAPYFKQLALSFDLDGRTIQVITRWYDRKPNVPGAMKDPGMPGVWVSQHVDCRATYETYWPEGAAD